MKVEVRRSARRRKTVSWRVSGNTVVIAIPARLSAKEEKTWVARICQKVAARRMAVDQRDDEDLWVAAKRLMKKYFEHPLPLVDIRWSTRQQQLYGSCTSGEGTVRVAERLRRVPAWVLDYVVVHELAHLVHADHSPAFWELVNRYPLSERARGFLLAMDLGFAANGDEEI